MWVCEWHLRSGLLEVKEWDTRSSVIQLSLSSIATKNSSDEPCDHVRRQCHQNMQAQIRVVVFQCVKVYPRRAKKTNVNTQSSNNISFHFMNVAVDDHKLTH